MRKLAVGMAILLAVLALALLSRGRDPRLPDETGKFDAVGGDRDSTGIENGDSAVRSVGRAVIFGTVLRAGHPTPARVEVRRVSDIARPGVINPTYGYDDLIAGIAARLPPADDAVEAGADGQFEFAAIRPGDYEVWAESPDGLRGSARVRVPADGVRVGVRVALVGGTETLIGLAFYADGTPFSGRIGLYYARREREIHSLRRSAGAVSVDEEGRFRFTGLDAGPVILVAAGPGNVLHTSEIIQLPRDHEFRFELGASEGPLTGRVVRHSDGKPIVGAEARVTGSGIRQWAVTDAAGKFLVPLRRPGLRVAVRARGYLQRTCEPGAAEPEVEIRLHRCAVVRGRVTARDTGEPAVGVDVFAMESNRGIRAEAHAVTDADGRYEIEGAPAGDVIVFAQGGGRVSPELAEAAFRGFNPLMVRLAPGEERIVDLIVVQAARAVGRVLDAAGNGRPGVLVRAWDASLRDRSGWLPDLAAAVTDADGAFTIEDLIPGVAYRFGTGSNPYLGLIVPGPGETLEVEIRADPVRRITVVLIEEETGHPIAGALVRCYGRNGRRVESEFPTAADGAALLLEAPTRELSIQVELDGLEDAGPVTVPAGIEDRTVEIRRRRGQTLDVAAEEESAESWLVVRVLDPDGNPVPRALLWCSVYSGTTSQTGGDPEPVIDGVGRYWIWGDPQEIRLVVGGAESAPGRPLDLGCAYVGPLAGDTREVEVRLPREATIVGVVRGADGRGVCGVQVRARIADHKGAVEPASQAHSGADGGILLRGLCEGDFEISALASGEFLPVAPQRVPAGTTDLVIELRRAVNPVLTFLDGEGLPLAGVHVVVSENDNRWKTIDVTRSDERGRARLRHLDPEVRYQLRLTAPITRSDLRLLPITDWVPADGTIRFETVRHITGKVVDEAGQPVEGAYVRIVMGDHTKGSIGPTGADGTFDIGSLPAGEADLRVLPPGAHRKEWESPFIPVATGSRDVVLVTSRGATVRGRVMGWNGEDRRVTLARLGREDAGSFLRGAAIAADGTFRFAGLPEGAEYALWLPPDPAGNSAFASGIKAGDAEAVLKLAPGRTITGRLRVPEGWVQPSVGAHRQDLGIHAPAVLAQDGTFVIRGLPDLEFDVHASVARTGKFLQGTARTRAGGSVDIILKE